MGTSNEFSIESYLEISGDFDAERLSSLSFLQAQKLYRRGEKGRFGSILKESSISFSGGVTDSPYIEDAIALLKFRLDNEEFYVALASINDIRLDVVVVAYYSQVYPGLSISSLLINWISELGASVSIDLYGSPGA